MWHWSAAAFALKMCRGPSPWFSLPFALCPLSGHANVGATEQPQGGLPPSLASHIFSWSVGGRSPLTLLGPLQVRPQLDSLGLGSMVGGHSWSLFCIEVGDALMGRLVGWLF